MHVLAFTSTLTVARAHVGHSADLSQYKRGAYNLAGQQSCTAAVKLKHMYAWKK